MNEAMGPRPGDSLAGAARLVGGGGAREGAHAGAGARDGGRRVVDAIGSALPSAGFTPASPGMSRRRGAGPGRGLPPAGQGAAS